MTFHEECLAGKTFDTPNMEWAKFVVENRLGIYNSKKYDYIAGPMADTGISRIRVRYRDGKISFDDAVDSIVVKTNGNQLVMLTKDALKKTRDIRKLVP